MTVNKQPRALHLADVLAAKFECDQEWYEIESAKELRRLHAENEDYGATIDYLTCENAEQIGEIVALKEQRDELLEALRTIERWRSHASEFAADYGSNGVRDLYRSISRAAIAKATGETK